MNPELFNQVVEEQMARCRDILVKKASEYAPVDRLSNFKKAAGAQGLTLKQALAGMMAKHTISIYDMIWSGEDYSLDLWEEKITDHINYLLILDCILEEELTEPLRGADLSELLEQVEAMKGQYEKDRAEHPELLDDVLGMDDEEIFED